MALFGGGGGNGTGGVAVVLGVYGVLIAFLVWVCVVSDPNDEASLGGRLNILLTENAPERLDRGLKRVLPQRVYDLLHGTYDYLVNQRNPLLQLLYLVLFLGCFAIYMWHGWGRLAERDLIISQALVLCCLYTFKLACGVSPGRISKEEWRRFDNYHYDASVYEGGKECPTCKVPKLARSKHCRLCGFCVSRFDHHCGWLNQCVGEENYKHFLGFVGLHVVAFFYGASRLVGVFRREVEGKGLLGATFYSPSTGQTVKGSPTVVVQYLFAHEGPLCGVLVLAVVMGFVLLAFLLYHLHLALKNVTTNETFKWQIARARVQRQREKALRAREITGGLLANTDAGALPSNPVNSYRLSPWYENWREVLRPRSQRDGAGRRREEDKEK